MKRILQKRHIFLTRKVCVRSTHSLDIRDQWDFSLYQINVSKETYPYVERDLQKRPIHMWKETYLLTRSVRPIHMWKETYLLTRSVTLSTSCVPHASKETSPYLKRDLQKRPTHSLEIRQDDNVMSSQYIKRDLYICEKRHANKTYALNRNPSRWQCNEFPIHQKRPIYMWKETCTQDLRTHQISVTVFNVMSSSSSNV